MTKIARFLKTAFKTKLGSGPKTKGNPRGKTRLASVFRPVARQAVGAAHKTARRLFSQRAAFTIGLVLLSFFVNFIFVRHPGKGKRWLSKIYQKPRKMTLQRVEGPLITNDMTVRVIKVRHNDKLYLDFLSLEADGSYRKINSVELKGSREGYFEYWGETASLGIEDTDGDGSLDVLAPAFDRFFLPHLNVVVYNRQTRRFELQPTGRFRPQVIERTD